MHRVWIALGSLAGLTAVGMSAYAAHGHLDAPDLEMMRNGLQMQGWHALALVACGVWGASSSNLLAHLAAAAFALGVVAFCGAVYLIALGGVHLGVVAPIGGTLLMVGWGLLGASALRKL